MSTTALLALLAAFQTAPDVPFEKLHAMVKAQPGEWNWARIPWMTDLAEARKRAAAEGKPLYVWTMAGEPLGQC